MQQLPGLARDEIIIRAGIFEAETQVVLAGAEEIY
jgi:hypothetical protein